MTQIFINDGCMVFPKFSPEILMLWVRLASLFLEFFCTFLITKLLGVASEAEIWNIIEDLGSGSTIDQDLKAPQNDPVTGRQHFSGSLSSLLLVVHAVTLPTV